MDVSGEAVGAMQAYLRLKRYILPSGIAREALQAAVPFLSQPSAARELALEEAARVAELLPECDLLNVNGQEISELAKDSFKRGAFAQGKAIAAAIRALSSPEHADAGKVEGDGSAAARDVLAERRRQVSAEGWTPEHDDTHTGGEMAGAAACYALYGATYNAPSHYPPRKVYAAVAEARRNAEKDMDTTREAIRMAIGEPKAPKNWPWNAEWWKPSDRRRNLVKAAALILAEIERLDRKASEGGSNV